MQAFEYIDGELYCEQVPLSRIAEEAGTPCYVYSSRALLDSYESYDRAFAGVDHLICFALKSNANLAVVHLMAGQGAGTDIVSRGELFRSLRAGVPGERIVYSGVGKTEDEVRYALENGIYCFNVESLPELEMIDRVAGSMDLIAPVSLRINPDVESDTHEYTTTGKKENKFGIPYDEALASYRRAAAYDNLRVIGIDTHIGSQILRTEPFVAACEKIARLYRELQSVGFELEFCDIGGGLGISYRDEVPPTPQQFAEAVLPVIEPLGCKVVVEPGRSISGNAGALLTRVIHYKQTAGKNFAVVDAGMNDIIRPSLYNAYHRIEPVIRTNGRGEVTIDVVGPICESGDWIAKDRPMTEIRAGELLCVYDAGAYTATMASNYNSRPRGAEVLVDGDRWRIVRRAESLEDLIRGEEL
ncbi:MAG: diaminopimelate decarboxylase [Candidatus Glassbacteria bacterium]|nr:diaminopimelate decarboxylase [Candidatus Glassbacteria bacterium]